MKTWILPLLLVLTACQPREEELLDGEQVQMQIMHLEGESVVLTIGMDAVRLSTDETRFDMNAPVGEDLEILVIGSEAGATDLEICGVPMSALLKCLMPQAVEPAWSRCHQLSLTGGNQPLRINITPVYVDPKESSGK